MKTHCLLLSAIIISASILYLDGCKKDNNSDPDQVDWKFGPASQYSISGGSSVTDTLSGYEFFSGTGTAISFSVSRILSDAGAPYAGYGYKIVYSGDEQLSVKIHVAAGNHVNALLYGYTTGLYNGELVKSWTGLPPMVVSADSTEFTFSVPQYFEMSGLKKAGKKRGSDLFWFSEISKESEDYKKQVDIELQSAYFLENVYFEACNPLLKQKAIAAQKAKGLSYSFGKENSYSAFWFPLGNLAPIYHPTINFKFSKDDPTAEDIAHETGHYFVNLLIGNEAQLLLCNQGSFFDNHGIGTHPGRDYVVDEYVYFVETTTSEEYQRTGLEEPVSMFSGSTSLAVDLPGTEGFGGAMLYSLVRTKATIQNIFNIKQKLDFNVIGLSNPQVMDIIAMGGTTINKMRENIQTYLSLYGTTVQQERFPVALQRIGWNYSVQGVLVDSLTGKPLEGYTVDNISKGSGGVIYNNGETADMHVTDSDGKFRFYGGVFSGRSVLRFSKNGMSTDVPINCPYTSATNSVIDLKKVSILTSTGTIAVGQLYQGGIIFYVDSTGKHGLIASQTDQSTNANWGCRGKTFSGTYIYIGTGKANTQVILDSCSEASIAARICDELELNGYSDWFLPSIFELNEMYRNKELIGGFADALYWSSSNWTIECAYAEQMTSGTIRHDATKEAMWIRVRAVRAF